ncbi:MAG: hypothetical protein H0W48_11275 [Methylibium sp.]|nr:hypothetical protein [Methylibium sp.]
MLRLDSSPIGWRPAFFIFVLLFMLSFRSLARFVLHMELESSEVLYKAATLSFNYVQFGPVRRGLASTLVYVLSPDRLLGTVFFHVLSAAAIAAAMAWLIAQVRAGLFAVLLFGVLAVSLMARWGEDAGRTDMLVATLLALAAWCVVRGRPVLACWPVAIGLFVHETTIVYGLPLLAGLLFDAGRYRGLSRTAALGMAGVLGAALLVYVVMGRLAQPDPHFVASAIRSALPPHKYVDWAIYFGISGSRGVETSVCQNLMDPNYALHVASGFLVIVLFVFALAGRRGAAVKPALFAGLLPFLFMVAVANDMSRWALLGAFNVWLLCVCSNDKGLAPARDLPWLRLAAAAWMLILIQANPQRVDYPIYAPAPLIEQWARKVGGPYTPNVEDALKVCDPDWWQVLDPAAR